MTQRHICRLHGRLALLLWTGLLLSQIVRPSEPVYSFESTPGQLPKNVVPLSYDLRLEPDLERFRNKGMMTVQIEVLRPTREIMLNALSLEIGKAELTFDGSADASPARSLSLRLRRNHPQQIALEASRELSPGRYRLTLEFSGAIGQQAQGLFYVKYSAPSGSKLLLCTQMEPADARRMFPCWDEPVFRATYRVTVLVPERHMAVSNMPIEKERLLGGGMKEVTFAETPPMPSYLLALVSGELEALSDQVEGVQLRILTSEGKKEQGRYALERTKKLLVYYHDYFGIEYPLPKLDQIAVPAGLSGAMENWGAITYDEPELLYDPATSSQLTRRDIYLTVAHEIAHQWFGNLVTMAWWNDLWLNEGFATWMETKAAEHFDPDWQVGLGAAVSKDAAMSLDAQRTAHPVQRRVENESQANDAFDDITYQKGGALLRMLESYLGEESFRKGIHDYLTAHKLSNATTTDLWAALQKASSKSVQAMAAGWTEQPGLPLVMLKTTCSNAQQMVQLRQQRFKVNFSNAPDEHWEIPVTLADVAHADQVHQVLLGASETTASLLDCQALIKGNMADLGYYRVLYEPEHLRRLVQAAPRFSSADRLELLNDVWALVEAQQVGPPVFLDLAWNLRAETNFTIWSQTLSVFETIRNLERGQPGRAAFDQVTCHLLQPQFERLGWEPRRGEPTTDAALRGALLDTLGHCAQPEIVAEAKRRFDLYLRQRASLPADLLAPVLNISGRFADRKIYDEIHALARRAAGAEERQLYYGALARAREPELARTTLSLALANEMVPQEATALVRRVASEGEHPDLAWDFLRQHSKALLSRVDSFERNNYVPSVLGAFSDAARADELERFVARNVSPEAVARAREVGEYIRLKAAMKRRELPPIDQWVASKLVTR